MNARHALTQRWTAQMHALEITGAKADRALAEIVDAYGAAERRYHGLAHLVHIFAQLDRVADNLADAPRAWMAAWFHDIVYDVRRSDNEDRSADIALQTLQSLGAPHDLAEATARLIRATAHHGEATGDLTDLLFLDADMAILGAPAATYDAYSAGVRQEYAWVEDALWVQGRGAFLQAQLARERQFHTDAFEDPYGAQARANLLRELESLSIPTQS